MEKLTLTRQPLTPRPPASPSYFFVIDGGLCRTVALPLEGELVIGRGSEAGLRLEDEAVSRRHARALLSGDTVVLVDLGSHNGTRVNGELLQGPRPLASGDVVTLCNTQLVFHADAPPTLAREALDVSEFRQRAQEELERAVHFERPATLAVVQFAAAPDAHRVRELLAEALRIIDSASWLGPRELALLLPECAATDTEGGGWKALLSGPAGTARAGSVTCPDDGRDLDTLLGVARSAAERAAPGTVGTAMGAAEVRTVANRSVIVADPAMVQVYALVDKLAPTELCVLVGGETGTGKELVALALHAGSRRQGGPLRSINCGALPEGLAESELFGHARGAFTGAVAAKAGVFESARGGTVFLDEMGELPLPLQAKLLRVLETRQVTRVGEVEERPIDVRIVAATHRDLEADIQGGRFREDLYYRLGAARLLLPPLRDRPREVALLARALLAEACTACERPAMVLSSGALAALLAHRWPGNVRELKNTMELVAATVVERVVQAFHLEPLLGGRRPAPAVAPSRTPEGTGEFRSLEEEIRELEQTRMKQALESSGGVKKRAAELLGMPLRTFATKHKLYQLP